MVTSQNSVIAGYFALSSSSSFMTYSDFCRYEPFGYRRSSELEHEMPRSVMPPRNNRKQATGLSVCPSPNSFGASYSQSFEAVSSSYSSVASRSDGRLTLIPLLLSEIKHWSHTFSLTVMQFEDARSHDGDVSAVAGTTITTWERLPMFSSCCCY
jgi:hypothetical protein